MALTAVLWDFGGVFTTSPFEAFNRYEREHGIPLDFIRGINATNPESNAWAQFESAAVSLDEFDALFAAESEAAGHRIAGREVVAMLSGDLRPRMVAALDRIRTRFRTACITNNVKAGTGPSMSRDADKAARVAEVMARFEVVVQSSIEGIRKPDPRIYELTCQRLGVAPEAALFIDDLGINLKPAAALGMQTIKVLDEEQALADLERATGLSLR